MASSLMLPMHFVEVSTRNTVSEALESVYGPRWPWNHSFEFSLPSPHRGFNPRSELVTVHAREATTDKVVAELKFVFWQKMFTQRFDARLWDGHILSLFPNAAVAVEADLRSRIYSDLEVIRKLRNRMAHHEPILPEILTMNWLRFWTSFNFVRRRFPHGFGQKRVSQSCSTHEACTCRARWESVTPGWLSSAVRADGARDRTDACNARLNVTDSLETH